MYSGKTSYQQCIDRMQQSINRLDHELSRSKQLLSHDITIDNRTQQDLNFTIKVQEQDQTNIMNKSESRVVIPHQTTYRHRICSTPREKHTNTDLIYSDSKAKERPHNFKDIDTSNYNEELFSNSFKYQLTTPKEYSSSIKVQRKFQPFSRIEANQSLQSTQELFNETNNYRRHATEAGMQTDLMPIYERKLPESKASERIQQEGSINYLPAYIKTEERQQKPSQYTDTVNLPVLLSQINKKNLDHYPYMSESPQVFNYLKQDYSRPYPYTPVHKREEDKDLTISFSSMAKSKQLYQQQRRQQKGWNSGPYIIGYQNNKKYFEQVKQKEMFNKIKAKAEQRRYRLSSSSQDKTFSSPASKEKQFGYIAQFEYPSGSKQKANDLFLQRKSLFLRNLQKNQEKEKKTNQKEKQRSKSKNNSFSYHEISTIKKTKPEERSRQMTSRVEDISERLYSRSKEKLLPCDHYQRRGESIERERFYGIVKSNSFVQKYVTKQEQQDLFQKFRREEQNVSEWPMKILNYTYSKLQKINASRYTIKKVPL